MVALQPQKETFRQAEVARQPEVGVRCLGTPVRVQWTREDEIRNGYYHAACVIA